MASCVETLMMRSDWCGACQRATEDGWQDRLVDCVTLDLEALAPEELIAIQRSIQRWEIGITYEDDGQHCCFTVSEDLPDPDGSSLIDSKVLVRFSGFLEFVVLIYRRAAGFARRIAGDKRIEVVERFQFWGAAR